MVVEAVVRWSSTFLSLAVVLPSLAQAQDAPPAPADPNALVPPVLAENATVTYPEAAIAESHFAETNVVVVLEIDATGAVTSATPVAVQGHGFDEAAVAAARTLRFEPARRGSTPIAVRIRFQFVFRPPSPRLRGTVLTQAERGIVATVVVTSADGTEQRVTSAADGSWEISGASPGLVRVHVEAEDMLPADADVELAFAEETNVVLRLAPVVPVASPGPDVEEERVVEVEVQGARPPREVTRRTLSRDEIDRMPGTRGDALLSLQSMPGIARTAFGGDLIVRGSAPDETTIYVDGTPIPLAYHFAGLSSVVPTETLERIDFYPGSYGATYGRGTAGMVDIALRDPSSTYHGFAQLDLIDARLLAEGPIASTGWRFLAAGRMSWFDTWLVPILDAADSSVSRAPRYYDYQLMLQRDFGARTSLRMTFFGSHDAMRVTSTTSDAADVGGGGGFGFGTSFYRLQAILRHRYSERGELRVTAAGGQDRIELAIGPNFIRTTETPISLRAEVSQRLGARVRGNVGVDLLFMPYELWLWLPQSLEGDDVAAPGAPLISATSDGSRTFAGIYTELEVVPWLGARVVTGFRADYASVSSRWDMAPRLSVRQDFGEGAGRTSLKGGAGLYFQPPSALQSDPSYGQRGLRSTRAVHYALGIEHQFTEHLDLSVEGFAKTIDRIVVEGSGNSGEGRAYGAETMLRYRGDHRFFGWLAYTVSRSERRESAAEPWHLFQYDQTHILTAVASFSFERGYRIGSRFRLVSGNPYTSTVNGGYDASAGSYIGTPSVPAFGERSGLFHALDLRVEKAWVFPHFRFTGYIDVQNIYNHRADEGVSYSFDYARSSVSRGLTILPSIGFRGEL